VYRENKAFNLQTSSCLDPVAFTNILSKINIYPKTCGRNGEKRTPGDLGEPVVDHDDGAPVAAVPDAATECLNRGKLFL
jgi:hypothetical protein